MIDVLDHFETGDCKNCETLVKIAKIRQGVVDDLLVAHARSRRRWFITTLVDLFLILMLGFVCVWSSVAHAYPETIRHGYPSCSGCHVAPGGGGALTAYGRMEAGATLSSGSSTCGLWESDYLDAGADFRFLNLNARQGATRIHKKFPMAAEGELAFHPVPRATIAATVGTYGPDQKQEYRRHYVMFQPLDGLYLSAGKKLPSFGINGVDHTAYVRSRTGFGEGTERYGWEVFYIHDRFETSAGYFVGSSLDLKSRSEEMTIANPTEETVIRSSWFPTTKSQLGLSLRWTGKEELQAFGTHAVIAPFPSLVLSLEGISQNGSEIGKREVISDEKISLEVARGVLPYLGHEYAPKTNRFRIGIQWLIIRGLEIEGRLRRTLQERAPPADEASGILHVYL
jgi:hypothetical protein